MKHKRFSFALLLLLTLFVVLEAAAAPELISYQGTLNDGGGLPVNSSVAMEFRIYDAASSGNLLWSENQNITVVNGVFNALLGSVTPVPAQIFNNSELYLAVKVGTDAEMTPRQRITSSSYSQRSGALVPVGSIIAWHKSASGTPTLEDGWVECNGQVLNDSESPYNGQTMPNMNTGNGIAVGKSTSGGSRLENFVPPHTHGPGTLTFRTANSYIGAQASQSPGFCSGELCGGETASTSSGIALAGFEVVWIIRVK